MLSPIFNPTLTRGLIAKHTVLNVGGAPILVDDLFHNDDGTVTISEFNNVISGCFFVFPKRVLNDPEEYERRIHGFVEGWEKTVRSVRDCFRGWKCRLHVDYSAWMSKDPVAAAFLEKTRALMEDLRRKYPPQLLELKACRYYNAKRGGGRKVPSGTTFLPAAWRFLAALDSGVDAVVVAEMDNPVSTLYMHFVERWLPYKSERPWMFFEFPDYFPPQCPMFMGDRRPGGSGVPPFCPAAQYWCVDAKNAAAVAPLLQQAFDVIRDKDYAAFFSPPNLELLRRTRAEITSHPNFFQASMDARDGDSAARALEAIEMEVGNFPDSTRKLAVCVMFAQYLAKMYALPASGPEGSKISRLLFNLHARLLEVKNATVDLGYGVDEWIQLCVLRNAPESQVMVISSDTPEAGMKGIGHAPPSNLYSTDQWVATLTLLLDDGTHPHARTLVDYVITTAAFLKMLAPLASSEREVYREFGTTYENYTRRMYYRISDQLVSYAKYRRPQEFIADWKHHVYENSYAMKTLAQRCVLVYNQAAFEGFCAANQAKFDRNQFRFVFKTVEGLRVIKDVLLRAFMLNFNALNASITSSNECAVASIPW